MVILIEKDIFILKNIKSFNFIINIQKSSQVLQFQNGRVFLRLSVFTGISQTYPRTVYGARAMTGRADPQDRFFGG